MSTNRAFATPALVGGNLLAVAAGPMKIAADRQMTVMIFACPDLVINERAREPAGYVVAVEMVGEPLFLSRLARIAEVFACLETICDDLLMESLNIALAGCG